MSFQVLHCLERHHRHRRRPPMHHSTEGMHASAMPCLIQVGKLEGHASDKDAFVIAKSGIFSWPLNLLGDPSLQQLTPPLLFMLPTVSPVPPA